MPEAHKRAYRHPKYKTSYRVKNRSLPDGPVYFIVDSTGLKICGQGEWHSKKHRNRQRKRWKKLHLGVDENGRILVSKVTNGQEQDPSQVPDLLAQVDRAIDRFIRDGIYDQSSIHATKPRWIDK